MSPAPRAQIVEALHRYAIHGIGDVKKMVGTPESRLRSGDFRVIFDEGRDAILVLALGDRREIYR